MNYSYDPIVVIGSGFGGSIAAAHLAEAGLPTILLERGPWRDTRPTQSIHIKNREPFPRGWRIITNFIRTLNHGWLPYGRVTLNNRGLFELFYSKGIEVVCSSSVGGGSHVYSGVHARPPDPNYWDGICDHLSEYIMKPHYESFIDRMNSVKVQPPYLHPCHVTKRFHETTFLEVVAPRSDARLGFLLPEDLNEPKLIRDSSGLERWETDYSSGDYGFLGAPSGAKTTLDVAYLIPAMRAGLEVRDLCEVISITKSGERRYLVHYKNHKSGELCNISTGNVIFAAGALNTLRILLHSRDISRSLDGMPRLGLQFSGNGDMRGFWDLNDLEMDLSRGPPSHGSIRIVDGVNLRQPLSNSGMPSVDSYPLPKRIRERLKRGVVLASMGRDNMDGIVSIRKRKMDIDFDPKKSEIYEKIWREFRDLSIRSKRKVYAFQRPATVHPMGGACVGRDRDYGVIDSRGEIFGHYGLFIADASALPRSIGGPPTASIAAWAGHVATGLAKELLVAGR